MDGTFKAFAISLPESSELIDRIPEADPVLLYQVCDFCPADCILIAVAVNKRSVTCPAH